MMTSIKIKFRPSTVEDKEGSIYIQIIHNRVVRQLNTDYKIFTSEWDEKSETIIANGERTNIVNAIKERLSWDIARLKKMGILTRKGCKEGKKAHMPPKTLNHWLNAGTRDHAVGKGSSLEGNKVIQQLIANKYQIAINRARLNLASAKTQKQRDKYQGMIERNTNKLLAVKARATKKASQHGRKVKGISARHFMEAIQRKVDSNAVAIVVEQVETAVADLLK